MSPRHEERLGSGTQNAELHEAQENTQQKKTAEAEAKTDNTGSKNVRKSVILNSPLVPRDTMESLEDERPLRYPILQISINFNSFFYRRESKYYH